MFACFLLLPIALLAQQRDTTSKTPVVASTGEISGSVVTAEANPQPIRRAVVTLAGGGDMLPRSVLTDDAGKFAFTGVPAGSFSLTARKAAYLASAHGAKRPGRAGSPVALGAGQRENVTITMFRGAAITGTLRDSSGLPLGGIEVRAIEMRSFLANPGNQGFEVVTTDDRGVYRIYSLPPGDYVLAALPTFLGQGVIGAPSTADLDAALAYLAARKTGAASSSAAANPPSPVQPRPIGFAPIFHPGTAYLDEASRVRLSAGDERSGVDITVKPVPVASIEGTVSGDTPNLATVQVTIFPMGPRIATSMNSSQLSGRAIDAQGNFLYSNLPPGRYRLVARAQRGGEIPAPPTVSTNLGAGGGRSGGPPSASSGTSADGPIDYLYGFADVDLRGEDVTGLSLPLQPGGVIAGRIVFTGTGNIPKPDDLSRARVSLALEGAMGGVGSGGLRMGTVQLTQTIPTVRPDGTFEIRGIGPGRFTLSSTLPADAKEWRLRSAMSGERDLLDEPLELGPGIDIRNITIAFSDSPAEVTGSLQSASGQSTSDYYILILPANRSLWRPKSRRIVSARPSTDGKFTFANLPAGEYVIAALTDLDPIDLADESFLEQVVPAGVKLTVTEGEKKVQDLRIK